MVDVEFKSDAVQRAFARIDAGLTDLSEVMNDIGFAMVASTKDRIDRGVTPDGAPFAPRSQVTLDRYAAQGIDPKGGPLRRRDDMRDGIFHAAGSDHVEIGSGAIQAAMMQFGGTRAQFPNLWGDIPARPFLGLSQDDEVQIVEIVEDWLDSLAD